MAQTSTQRAPIFEAPDKPLNVSATGAEALGRAGARVGEEAQTAGRYQAQGAEELAKGVDTLGKGVEEAGSQLQQHENQVDVTNVNNAHVGLITSLQQAHDQWFADPANHPLDPGASQRFQQDVVQPATDGLRDIGQTKLGAAHAEDLANNLDVHFANLANQTAARNAAVATKQSLDNQTTALADTVAKNPANLPLALSTFDQSANAYQQANPDLSPETVAADRQQFRQTMIATAAKATIDQMVQNGQTPDLTKLHATYGDDLGPDGVKAINDYTDAQVQAKRVDIVATQNAQKQQFTQNSATAASGIFDNLGNMDANHPASQNFVSGIIARPDMATDDKGAIIGAYRRITSDQPPVDTSSTTMDGLVSTLASTADRPTPATIMGQYAAGRLSYEDASWAIKAASAPPSAGLQQLNQNLTAARSTLMTDPGSGAFNPAGAAAYQRFQSFAVNAYRQDEAIDPKQLPTILATFQPTGQDALGHVPVPADRPSLNAIFGGK